METAPTTEVLFDTNYAMTIGGVVAETFAHIPVINPANEQVFANAPDCTTEQLDAAVAAAAAAFPDWSATPYAERQALLIKMAQTLEAQITGLSELLTSEQGKTLRDATVEIGTAAYWLRETSKLIIPETINDSSDGHRSVTRHIPLGVIGAIAPWNFPVLLAVFKLSSALLAGNTVVLKPSPLTPLTTLKVGELMQQVLPAGVLNVISGGDGLGPQMTSHPGFAKISFTGSTTTGRKVMQGAAAALKHLTLELGGNDAAIVMPDVAIETVAKCIFWSSFGNSGQICLASKRIYIHEAIYDAMRDELVRYARTIKVGIGTDPASFLGPVQNKTQYERVIDLIRDCRDNGYQFALGGMPEDTTGYFVPLTIIDNPPADSRIVREEQFGPVLPLIKFKDIEDAIMQANDSEYGLGATVWSGDADTAAGIASRLQAGSVWVNEAMALSPLIPFAGHKQSGLGCEAGLAGLLEYTALQTIGVRADAATWFGIAGL